MIYKMATGNVNHVVVDSGAFIRNAPIREIGENIYTLRDIVNEIKDKTTRDRLQVLPYTIKYKEPSSQAILFITEFAKKTGDYRNLSVVDIRLLALTYQLEKENVGTDHIKKTPPEKAEWNMIRYNLEKPTDIAGFYLKPQKDAKSRSRNTSECTKEVTEKSSYDKLPRLSESSEITSESPLNVENSHSTNQAVNSTDQAVNSTDQAKNSTDQAKNSTVDSSATTISPDKSSSEKTTSSPQYNIPIGEGHVLKPEDILEGQDTDSDDDTEEEDDDDDGGWITPSNIDSIRKRMGDTNTEKADVQVGCMTTDFAMQNVLIQMGLNVISVDGMLIKKAKNYVLRCFACMKITKKLDKLFCPHCGNKTLKRLSMTVEEDGSIKYYFSARKLNCTKGMNKNLGMPRTGRHANNPYLVEDQPMPQQHPSRRSQVKVDALSYDYVAGSSPFAINDVTSRAAQLGINNKRMREFHQNGKRTFIRKK